MGLLLALAEGFGLRPRLFCPLGKKELFILFVLILGHFECSVVTSLTFSSNLINFEKNPKITKIQNKIQKIQKNPIRKKKKIIKNTHKKQRSKIPKNLKISKNHFFFSKNLKIMKIFVSHKKIFVAQY